MQYDTIKVNNKKDICEIQINHPEVNNAINTKMIREFNVVLDAFENQVSIVIIKGLQDYFCTGADFNSDSNEERHQPQLLYQLWNRIAVGPFVSIAHVRGRVSAGGMGFIAASDVVIADSTATFCSSEMLFGLFPAMVMPFLIRKIGFQKANYMTLTTKTISVERAIEWGLVDAFDQNSEKLVQQHLVRINKIPKSSIIQYKMYMSKIYPIIEESRVQAVEANLDMFDDCENKKRIQRFSQEGILPWE